MTLSTERGRLRFGDMDEEAENVCEALADALFPHVMDTRQKELVRRLLGEYLRVAFRGAVA